MTGSDAMARCLQKEGVEVIFGYTGAAIASFYESLERETQIRQVLVRMEQSAAHMASGYARISGKVGVCSVTSGPGATNLLTGIATAFADSIPLVCITGQVNSDMIGSDVFQEADIIGAAESFVKYSYLVRRVQEIPQIFKEAFHIANTGRKGPVLIDVPQDVQEAALSRFSYPEEVHLRSYKPTVKGNTVQIRKVITELSRAERPILCVGGGVFSSGAVEIIRDFAHRFELPVVSTMMGIGVMPSEDPLYFGMVGNNGEGIANLAMNDADLLLMVGARVADRAVNRPDLITENKVLVHIDVDPAEIGKNVGPTIPLVGDIAHIFRELLNEESIAKVPVNHSAWLNDLYNDKSKFKVKTQSSDPAFVEPAAFYDALSRLMDDDAVFVADVGQNQIWSCRYIRVRSGRFLTSGGMGTMGYAIPAAIGAQMAAPDRQVIAVCGDGGFAMSMAELAAMRQEKAGIKIVVLNNRRLGMVREYQHYHLHDSRAMVVLEGEPDLSLLAKAYDLPYVRIDGKSALDRELNVFLREHDAAILEVMIDPDANTPH
ncbi:MAG: biosynthetic-type acetolactate synthase large subunit [Lachnospiraceae bacterium]|nr:biosynthetic-type acetolactate synthase large subunit [Lachnospiraceae bacterium]